jgi:hypothetical protein
MKKHVALVPFVLLIASIILFSSFLKEKPSYIGLARTVGQPRSEKPNHEVIKPVADYTKREIPEIAPVVSIIQAIPEPATEKVTTRPEKKAVRPAPKKEVVISSPVTEEADVAQPDTAAFQTVSKPDTTKQVSAAVNTMEQPQGKKKKKKFLFFK